MSSGSGWAISSSWEVGEQWLPFIRIGSSDGGAGVAAEDAVSVGFEFTVRNDQKWALGAGWSKPSEQTNGGQVDDEYVVETSYNLQIGRNFSLLPDIQLIINPLNNPAKSKVWVGGLRAIATF